MAPKKRTWIWIGVAVAGVLALGLVTVVAAGFLFVTKHVEAESASTRTAEKAFADARARFDGQLPIVQIDDRDGLIRTRVDRPPPEVAEDPSPETIFVMVYDPWEERLVRLSVPLWLLRLGNRGAIRFSSNRSHLSFKHLNLTVDDLSRYGPALLIDHQMSDGERVLIWLQ